MPLTPAGTTGCRDRREQLVEANLKFREGVSPPTSEGPSSRRAWRELSGRSSGLLREDAVVVAVVLHVLADPPRPRVARHTACVTEGGEAGEEHFLHERSTLRNIGGASSESLALACAPRNTRDLHR